ncbi:(2Fe-2S)-binding protein [Zobellella iuensis]|uniref:BFD-like [2Fe-2S]-binding domain-containing protein n=1 Tax=Zobellella iuensis TaxID=2803811 RepID=A0ABS1QXB1_9GAMM|nr:hypothetical protein [Zobellella iuensis]MBL1379500.1 hypothetical protein [Zobellella iuensis]
MTERTHCTCHDLDIEAFRGACGAGAHNVKTCFKHLGCLPKCANCVPMVRKVLGEHAAGQPPQGAPTGSLFHQSS